MKYILHRNKALKNMCNKCQYVATAKRRRADRNIQLAGDTKNLGL